MTYVFDHVKHICPNRTSREFELRANCLAKLEVLSYSAQTIVTLELPCMLHTCASFGNLPAMS